MKPIDISNQRFGKLVALSVVKKNGRRVWKCKCDCGNITFRPGYELRGQSKSCGCINRPNLIGHTFGRLTVIEETRSKWGKRSWKCQCECGKTSIVETSRLRNGHTRSCGCRMGYGPKDHLRKPKGHSNKNTLIASYRNNAKRRGHLYTLTLEQATRLFEDKCHYCGTPPSRIINKPGTNGAYVYNGIDRIDNSQGYEMSNVVTCCWLCNNKKADMNYNEFLTWIERVHGHVIRGWGDKTSKSQGSNL